MKLAKGSAGWLLGGLGVALLLGAAAWLFGLAWLRLVAVAVLVVELFFLWFFRDPERKSDAPTAWALSPADGKVVRIDVVDDPDLGRCDRVAIFMSPVDVHVNRWPVDGTLVGLTHIQGGHVPAFNKDSDQNERVVARLETARGPMKVIQIAGTVARRIVPYVEAPHDAVRGARYGLIRFGSRCDVLTPQGTWTLDVAMGAKTQAGETVLMKPNEASAQGNGPKRARGSKPDGKRAKPKANAKHAKPKAAKTGGRP